MVNNYIKMGDFTATNKTSASKGFYHCYVEDVTEDKYYIDDLVFEQYRFTALSKVEAKAGKAEINTELFQEWLEKERLEKEARLADITIDKSLFQTHDETNYYLDSYPSV